MHFGELIAGVLIIADWLAEYFSFFHVRGRPVNRRLRAGNGGDGDLQCKVMDECVQLHGGYGYMWEYPIARAYADARVQRIYGGTNEIMKEVISRSMGLTGRER